jgi:D-glycero-D-manno-heptose 1,7-bisphosphate phosphatase
LFRAVFLDRDGTINVEKNYVHKIDDFEFIEGSAEAIRLFNEHEFKVVVVSNQSGIARGLYTRNDVHILHDYIQRELGKINAHIDAFFYCPHHADATVKEYRVDCDCRKPRPGMLRRAEKKLDLDLKSSYIIGDLTADMEMGRQNGLYSILVKTGHGMDTLDHLNKQGLMPDAVADNLLDAVQKIYQQTIGFRHSS